MTVLAFVDFIHPVVADRGKGGHGALCGHEEERAFPRTIKEYSEVVNRFPSWFCRLPVSDVTQIHINKLVNEVGPLPKDRKQLPQLCIGRPGDFLSEP